MEGHLVDRSKMDINLREVISQASHVCTACERSSAPSLVSAPTTNSFHETTDTSTSEPENKVSVRSTHTPPVVLLQTQIQKEEETPVQAASSAPKIDKNQHSSFVRSFLGSTGLKYINSLLHLEKGISEAAKPVIVRSRLLALARAAVHLLPICTTVAIIALNGKGYIYGPEMSNVGKYLLQAASKLHELTIIGSLTTILIDIVRHCLINNSLPLAFVSSPFSFSSLSFFWSHDFLSVLTTWPHVQNRSQILHMVLLVVAGFLATLVGPTSALLLLPSQSWLPSGSTDFYLGGTESQLWPQRLTAEHTGPPECMTMSPSSWSGYFACLYGGWLSLQATIAYGLGPLPKYLVADALRPRIIQLFHQSLDTNDIGMNTWGVTLHGATLWHSQALNWGHDIAWNYAHGQNERLRSAGQIERPSERVRGPVPVVRTACGPLTNSTSFAPHVLPFPVFEADKDWTRDAAGRVMDVDVTFRNLSMRSAQWITLPPAFGATAGLAYFMQHETGSVGGFGCSIDARWAKGEIYEQAGGGVLTVWEVAIGKRPLPQGLRFAGPSYSSMFDQEAAKYLGQKIEADEEWLEALDPPLSQPSVADPVPATPFSALLGTFGNSNASAVTADANATSINVQAVTTLYFLNALARVGWHRQLSGGFGTIIMLSDLELGNKESDSILNGGPVYTRPKDIPTSVLRAEWFTYATVWQLNDNSLYISIAVLGLYVLLALCHTVYTISSGTTSSAWDSITEVIALAINSERGLCKLDNCGAGVMYSETLRKKMKVVSPRDGHGEERVELVSCNQENLKNKGDIKAGNLYG